MKSTRLRVRIDNRVRGGLRWRIPAGLAVLVLWAAVAGTVVGGVIVIAKIRGWTRDLPATPDLDAFMDDAPRTGVIVAADGTVLADQPFRVGVEAGRRELVRHDELPPHLIQALLAAEDVRFFEHAGVDLVAVVRAAWANYRAGSVVEGASTISQQVVRGLLPEEIGRERSMRRKVREAVLARRLELRWSKERILEAYANLVYLGNGAYGVKAAARQYFDKRLDQLTLDEMALLAGMAQAPGRTNPVLGGEPRRAAQARRDQVLQRMAEARFITGAEAAAAIARPIALRSPPNPYGHVAAWDTERVRREIFDRYPGPAARGALRVETAIQPVLAEEALARARRHAERLDARHDGPAPQVAALLWDHRTGYLEATVGGTRWAGDQFDRSHQACRQPGSAFKPLLYAAAVDGGVITAGTPLRDAPVAEYDEALDVHWKPTNSGRAFRGVALAHEALAASLNAPAVDVLDRVGAEAVARTARRLGITSELADVRPLALGASCVVPVELAGAFSAFARRGDPAPRITIVRVVRGDTVVFDRAAPADPWLAPGRRLDRLAAGGAEVDPAVAPATAYIIASMLRDVVRRGTATDARRLGRAAAGKTGTTNRNTDAWFVGFTGRMLSAVWVGHDDPARVLGAGEDGAHAALPLWMELVRLAEADRRELPVPGEPPPGMVRARIDTETGLLAAPGSGGAIELWFVPGTEPTERSGATQGVPRTLGRTSREF